MMPALNESLTKMLRGRTIKRVFGGLEFDVISIVLDDGSSLEIRLGSSDSTRDSWLVPVFFDASMPPLADEPLFGPDPARTTFIDILEKAHVDARVTEKSA